MKRAACSGRLASKGAGEYRGEGKINAWSCSQSCFQSLLVLLLALSAGAPRGGLEWALSKRAGSVSRSACEEGFAGMWVDSGD